MPPVLKVFVSFLLSSSFCKNSTLDPTLIKGKIVVCMIEVINESRREKSEFVKQGGGVGMILIDQFAKGVGFQFAIPGALMVPEEAKELQAYMATAK